MKRKPKQPERYFVVLALKEYLYRSPNEFEIGCLPVYKTREAAERAWGRNVSIQAIERVAAAGTGKA